MKFFIDTANLDEIREAAELGILDGVTTNPTLISREGVKGKDQIFEHYRKICQLVDGPVSAEVIATDYEGMVREARELAQIHPNIVVKIPMIKDGLKAIKTLSQEGIRTNCTLVFSPGQAILAAKAGATFVSPFLGRLDDIASDGINLLSQIVQIYRNYDFETEVLAASIRSTQHIIFAAEIGADIVTAPLKAILGLLKHPLTDIGLQKFLEDYKKTQA